MRVIFPVIDLESSRGVLQDALDCRRIRRAEIEAEITAQVALHEKLDAEHREVSMRWRSVAAELGNWERSAGSSLSELREISIRVQKINGEIERQVADANGARTAVLEAERALRESADAEEAALRAFEEESERAKSGTDLGMIEIAKKKALIAQLERKLEDMRADLVKQQEEGPRAAELRGRLAKEMREREIAQEEYAQGKEHVVGLRTLLELKERVIEDLSKWCPLNSKIKVRPGLDELRFVFDVALTRNRDMAGDLQVLVHEMNALQAEKRCLAMAPAPSDHESEGMDVIYHVLNLV
jgi:chromosome segregation ATPase